MFEHCFTSCLACGGTLVVVEHVTSEAVGPSRYYDWDPQAHSITIGDTFRVRRLWGGLANAERKRLMIDHAFGLAREVRFEVGRDNLRSRRVMKKNGAELLGEHPAPTGATPAPLVLYRMWAPAYEALSASAAAVAVRPVTARDALSAGSSAGASHLPTHELTR